MSTLPYGIAPPSYRLPDATHVGAVRLQVADLSRSIDYYTDVIGLRVTQTAGPRAWLAAHGDDTPLVELHARAGARRRCPGRGGSACSTSRSSCPTGRRSVGSCVTSPTAASTPAAPTMR